MPYLIIAALVLLLGTATVWIVYRADTQARRDRDRTAVTPRSPH